MKNNVRMFVERTGVLSLLLLISLGFFGCSNRHVASIDNRALVSEKKSNQGIFEDGGLTVRYNYSLNGDKMFLTGDVSYSGRVDSLDVRILFLDPAGTVLQRKIIYYSGYRVFSPWEAERKIQTNLIVPNGATGISFSYSARPRSSHK